MSVRGATNEEVTIDKERKEVYKRERERERERLREIERGGKQVFVIPISRRSECSPKRREEKLASRKLTCNVRHFWLARFDNLDGVAGSSRMASVVALARLAHPTPGAACARFSLYVTSRCTTLSVSILVALLPRSSVSPSLSLMNSTAINSIKTSVVLGGFYPSGRSSMHRGRPETRSRRKSSKQSSRRSMSLPYRRITVELAALNFLSIITYVVE